MREVPFRAYAERHLRGAAPASYLANCRLVERTTARDLDTIDLSEPSIGCLRDQLRNAGIPAARISDAMSAARMYRRFLENTATVEAQVIVLPSGSPDQATDLETPPAFSTWLEGASTTDLLQAYAAILRTLRARGVTRTGNGPLGDYAEQLFARAMGWTLTANSTAGHDAIDRAGLRFQIKARRRSGAGFRQLGIIRKLDDHQFDMIAAVLFTPEFAVERALLVPHAVVVAYARPVAHTNGWRLMFTDLLINAAGVRDVTEVVRATHSVFGALGAPD